MQTRHINSTTTVHSTNGEPRKVPLGGRGSGTIRPDTVEFLNLCKPSAFELKSFVSHLADHTSFLTEEFLTKC